jgi:hypothetical protein
MTWTGPLDSLALAKVGPQDHLTLFPLSSESQEGTCRLLCLAFGVFFFAVATPT